MCMSVHRSTLLNSDPFLMTQHQVNEAIATFFKNKGFKVTISETGNEIDVIAEYNAFNFLIESRGNQALRHYGTDKIFDSSQISIHLAEQVEQIMRFQQQYDNLNTTFYIMGNPDIRRIRERVSRIDKALDKLGIIRGWVKEHGEVIFEGDKSYILDLEFRK